MDSGRNYKITRAILVMTAILTSVVIGSLGVSHNQNPSTDTPPETVAKLSRQPLAKQDSPTDRQSQSISPSLSVNQATVKRISSPTVVYRSGTLLQDETWSSENVYVVDDSVVIPQDKTLTIGSGTIIKSDTALSAFTVESGGKLVVAGADDNPVIITSINDDAIGGDTANDGDSTAQKGDYETAIATRAGSIVDIHNARVTYSATAFYINGGQIDLANMTVDNVDIGLDVSSGKVTFSGLIRNTEKGIQVCSWEVQGCSVSLLRSDERTDTIEAPVCGQVVVLLQEPDLSLVKELERARNCEDTTPILSRTSLTPETVSVVR